MSKKMIKYYILKNKMFFAWVLSIVVIVALGFLYQGMNVIFSGVAEATETTVSVQSAVEVVSVHVVVGQEINDGDTLVKLSRGDLVLRINEVNRELDALEGRGSINTATIDQKVAEVQADLATKKNTIRFEIEKLKSEYQKNLDMASKLKSLSSNGVAKVDSNDAMIMRIRNLEQELKMAEANAQAQFGILRGSKGLQKTSSASEAEALRRELEILKKEQDDLVITSKGSWVVASVNVRDGEKISSFFPIITLTRKSPSLIRGYIHEKMYKQIDVGTKVDVMSQADGKKLQGEIIALSSRIVEFPVRLRKTPEIIVYGREVIIRIPEDNALLLGEMVTISEIIGLSKLLHSKDDK